jgi:hypothetical protein
MSEATFHTTRENIRKPESKIGRSHDGQTPADSNVSAMKVYIFILSILMMILFTQDI